MSVFRVWFYSRSSDDACCVLVSTSSSERAIELATEQVKAFPNLDLDNPSVQEFDTTMEHCSLC